MKENTYLIENLIIEKGAVHLQESAPAIVYHSTSPNSVKKILLSNTFNLTSKFSSTSDEDAMKGSNKYFYLSTSTSKASGYRLGILPGALLVLDGEKLNYRYKAIPVDYWGPKWRQGIKTSTMHPVDKAHAYATSDEQEIRILSNSPTIPKARDYILEIHLLAPEKEKDDTNDFIKGMNITSRQLFSMRTKILNDIIIYNIPIFIYGEKKDFRILNKSKAYEYKEPYESGNYLDALIKATKIPLWGKDNKELQSLIDEVDYRYFTLYVLGESYIDPEFIQHISSDLKGNKGKYSINFINLLSEFAKLMKKYKATSIKDLLIKVQADHTKEAQQ